MNAHPSSAGRSDEPKPQATNWAWASLDEIGEPLRGLLRGDVPVPADRFLAFQPGLMVDPRLYTGFVAFSAACVALWLMVGMPLQGHEPAWIAGVVALLVGLAAGVATKRLKGPQVRARHGLFLLDDQLVAFDGEQALVIPRAQLRQCLATTGAAKLVRHDNSWFHLDAGYVLRYQPGPSHFNQAFKRWVATGEPVFNEREHGTPMG